MRWAQAKPLKATALWPLMPVRLKGMEDLPKPGPLIHTIFRH
jgi:hypothetical protein